MCLLVRLILDGHHSCMILTWLRVPWLLRRLGLGSLLRHEALLEQVARFLVGGGTAALVNVLVLMLFTEVFHVWYVVSVGIASVCSFVTSFLFHKYWTFEHREGSRAKQFAMHATLGVWNVLFGMAMVYAFVEWAGLHYVLAQILMIAITAVLNFLIYRFVIFRRVQGEQAVVETLAEL